MVLYTIFLCTIFSYIFGQNCERHSAYFRQNSAKLAPSALFTSATPKKSGAFGAENRYTFFHIRFSMYEKNVYFPGKRQHTDIRFFHT